MVTARSQSRRIDHHGCIPGEDSADHHDEGRGVQRRTKTRRFAAAAVAIAVAFILTACGARIDTVMNVGEDGSGTRVMTLTLAASDVSKLNGGPAAADASIRSHLPKELTYSGLQTTGDGGQTATVTLTFDSTADYKTKAAAVLDAGGIGEADTAFTVSDSTLVKGIQLEESYTSADLLKWLFAGLTSDGVLSSENASNAYELGSSTVNFGGIAHDAANTIQLEDVVNHGFDSVKMSTTITDLTHVTRTITYTAIGDHADQDKKILDQFIREATPSGATVKTTPETRTISFAGDPEKIAEDTTKALGGTTARFELTLTSAADDPSEKILSLVDVAGCDAVCATPTTISDAVTTGAGYTPHSQDIDTSTTNPAAFTYAPPITSVTAKYGVGLDGGVTATIDFVIPKASVAAVGDGFKKALTPAKGAGSISSSTSGGSTTYTVTITGKNTNEFTREYARWARDGSADAVDRSSSWFTSDTSYAINPALASVIGNHKVTKGVSAQLTLPFGSWISAAPTTVQQSAGITGATVTTKTVTGTLAVTGTSPTIGGIIVLIVILAVIIVGVLLLIRHRRTVAARIRTVRGNIDAALVEQRLLAGQDYLRPTTVGERGSVLTVNARMPAAAHGSLLDLPAQSVAGRHGSLLDVTAGGAEPGRRHSLFGDTTTPNRNSLLV